MIDKRSVWLSRIDTMQLERGSLRKRATASGMRRWASSQVRSWRRISLRRNRSGLLLDCTLLTAQCMAPLGTGLTMDMLM